MDKVTGIVSRGFLLLAVSAGAGAFLVVRSLDGNLELTVLAVSLAVLLSVILLERLMPYRAIWNRSHGDIGTDLMSAGVLIGMVDPLLKYLAPVAVVYVYSLSGHSALGAGPLAAWPFLLQLALATLLIELGRYWAHRWHHRSPRLWWLHAMHHSSERLYAINNFRFHPLNHLNNFVLSTLPVMLLGMPGDVLLGYLAITQPVLMIQHANVDLRSGVMNYIFSTNEVHRWHHSDQPEEANSNYGSALMIWDQVFGTFRYHKDGNQPRRVGLFAESGHHYPGRQGYLKQLFSMFGPDCCKA